MLIGIEQHQIYSKTPKGLDRLYRLVKSPAIGINFDTGNAYLAGADPHKWFADVIDRVVHVHAKDISVAHSKAERGKVAGTPVGCACGEGVVDWKEIVRIIKKGSKRKEICLSVECGDAGAGRGEPGALETLGVTARIKPDGWPAALAVGARIRVPFAPDMVSS